MGTMVQDHTASDSSELSVRPMSPWRASVKVTDKVFLRYCLGSKECVPGWVRSRDRFPVLGLTPCPALF